MKNYRLYILLLIVGLTCSYCKNGMMAEKAKMDSIANADSIAKVDSLAYFGDKNSATLANDINLNTKTPKDKKFVKTGEVKFKVNSVIRASERIEDLAAKYDGYLTYSNLRNSNERVTETNISHDSLLRLKQIVVENSIRLRIPNETLDSFIRSLNGLVVFLDYRVIKMEDVTFASAMNQKRAERLKTYSQRQQKHIDTKGTKLKETTPAEENLLQHQDQMDDLQMKTLELEDRLKYCDVSIEIYQKPIIIREILADFGYASNVRINFWNRAWDSIVDGWHFLEEIVIVLLKIWGVAFLVLAIVLAYRYVKNWLNTRKKQ